MKREGRRFTRFSYRSNVVRVAMRGDNKFSTPSAMPAVHRAHNRPRESRQARHHRHRYKPPSAGTACLVRIGGSLKVIVSLTARPSSQVITFPHFVDDLVNKALRCRAGRQADMGCRINLVPVYGTTVGDKPSAGTGAGYISTRRFEFDEFSAP